MTVFKKIIDKEIPAKIVYEDDLCLAFHDAHPKAPVHILIIPKKEIPSLAEVTRADQDLLGHMLIKLTEIARDFGIDEKGYRTAVNTRDWGGQEVNHLHFHLLGGKPL